MTMVSERGHAHEMDLLPGRLQVINCRKVCDSCTFGKNEKW